MSQNEVEKQTTVLNTHQPCTGQGLAIQQFTQIWDSESFGNLLWSNEAYEFEACTSDKNTFEPSKETFCSNDRKFRY